MLPVRGVLRSRKAEELELAEYFDKAVLAELRRRAAFLGFTVVAEVEDDLRSDIVAWTSRAFLRSEDCGQIFTVAHRRTTAVAVVSSSPDMVCCVQPEAQGD
ncbi:hypothetical protein AOLI_G00317290 [Acnodon oligacanthus]